MKKVLPVFLLFGLLACHPNNPTQESSEEAPTPSWAFPYFEKVDRLNPILSPSPELVFQDPITGDSMYWEERNVLNPTAIVKDGKVHLLYRAQDLSGTSRIGMAVSSDGLHFEKMPAPVFYPDEDVMKKYEWNFRKDPDHPEDPKDCDFCFFDGVEDPRIVEDENGRYIMTYTSYEGKTARLSLATSPDLQTWTKHGLVLGEGKYKDTWSKAGAIVVQQQGSRMVAQKINGKYWMYYGDTNIFLASSEDLIHWTVEESREYETHIAVMHPRSGYFDSRLVEPGPYAILKEEGILLIYNGSNAMNFNDPELPQHTYAAGQALFDKNQPNKLIDRTDTYFIHPDKDYEKVGEVNEVCFVEGLVYFQEKWFLYYGTADSKIAVAVYEPDVL
jgi:predicted GH43/DUF377 family glycosyl hydrolase